MKTWIQDRLEWMDANMVGNCEEDMSTTKSVLSDNNFSFAPNPVIDNISYEGTLPPLSDFEENAINLPLSAMSDIDGTNQMLEDLGIIVIEDDEAEVGDS